jgi:serine/threonine protein kinase
MRIAGRYELRGKIAEGGMGVVYRAEDLNLHTEVAVKTIKNPHDEASLELFRKEGAVLRSLNHPNIVEIRDVGDYEHEGIVYPFLVMPLLRGMTLDKIIDKQPGRLTPERVIEMMIHVCRGLQAAHEARLIHRDLKPSNLFVFDDDSIKIIDFGIAHLTDQKSTVGGKGTLEYMSPEQIRMQKLTPESDIFSLGVICFECLTRRRPFSAATADEVVNNILKATPASVSDLNPAVPALLSQVIHLAMAKQPVFRYRSASEFGDCLQKAIRNIPIERFDPTATAPRLDLVRQALEASDYEDARDLLDALEAEGCLHSELPSLRKQVNMALRNRRIGGLMDSARRLFEKQEYQLVIERLQRILDEDPHHREATQLLQSAEGKRQEFQYEKWIRLAEEHLRNHSFAQAREAAEHARETDTTDRVLELLTKIEAEERRHQRIRKEKEELYHSALEQHRIGNLTQAADRLEKLISLNNQAPEKTSPDRAAAYEKLFNEVRSERDTLDGAVAEARRHLSNKDYAAAQAICGELLEKYPRHAVLRNLRLEIIETQQLDLSAYMAKVDHKAAQEPDLDRKVAYYEEALQRFPGEGHFSRRLQTVTEQRDDIHARVKDARNKEERGQYGDALNQWEYVETLYPKYPGLELEMERVRQRLDDQVREDAWLTQIAEIRRLIEGEEFDEAIRLAAEAQADRPGDPEVRTMAEVAESRRTKAAQANAYLEAGKAAQSKGDLDRAIQEFRHAYELGEIQVRAKARLIDALVARSREILDADPAKAAELAQEAMSIDDGNTRARAQFALVTDRSRGQLIGEILSRAGAIQERGEVDEALRLVDEGLQHFPHEARLTRYRETLREAHLERAKGLRQSMRQAASSDALDAIFAEIQQLTGRHGSDPRFQDLARQAGSEREQLGRTMLMPRASAAVAGSSEAGTTDGGSFDTLTSPHPRIRVPLNSPVPPPPVAPAAKTPSPVAAPVHPAHRTQAPPRNEPVKAPPAPAASSTVSKPVWIGIAAAAVVVVGLAAFVLRPSSAPAPVASNTPAIATPAPAPAAPARPPGILVNLEGGTVELKNAAGVVIPIKERGVPVDLEPGTYEFLLRDQASATYTATLAIGQNGQLTISNAKSSPGMLLTVFELRNRRARVLGTQFAGLTRDTVQSVPPEGIELDLPANSMLVVGASKIYAYDVALKPEDRPVIQMHVRDTTKGVISICDLPAGATAELTRLDAKAPPLKLPANPKGCSVAQVQIGQYRASASGEGLAPRQVDVNVRFGMPTEVKLPLQPLSGRIHVTNAEPGADVLVNGVRKATVGNDGTVVVEAEVGNQTIALSKRNFTATPAAAVKVEPGQTVAWSGTGHLTLRRFAVSVRNAPANVVLYLRRNGREEPLGNQQLPTGDYAFIAKAPGYLDKEFDQSIGEGLPNVIDLSMTVKQTAAPVVAAPVRFGAECLAARTCGPFPGKFEFNVKRKGGLFKKGVAEWRLESGKGQLVFKLDKDKMQIGKTEYAHHSAVEENATVSCAVFPTRVECKVNNSAIVQTPAPIDLTGSRLSWLNGDLKSLAVELPAGSR